MDHVVYLDYKAKEFQNLILGKKTMIIRGAMGRKIPYERAAKNDVLYFVVNKGDAIVKAKAKIAEVYFSDKLTKEDSFNLIDKYQSKLMLNTALKKRFAGKRYLSLITITDFSQLDHPFEINMTKYSNMDDWLLVKSIENILIRQEV